MKSANIYDIERALAQPITPQQRQAGAAGNPLAAIVAQRYDGLENNLRQKIQTPPPPQGTVMQDLQNQYLAQLGLAVPGLEQLAQQYAAGGLVAFADGGLASMLPQGYAGDDGMPYFDGYAFGGVTGLDDKDDEDIERETEEELGLERAVRGAPPKYPIGSTAEPIYPEYELPPSPQTKGPAVTYADIPIPSEKEHIPKEKSFIEKLVDEGKQYAKNWGDPLPNSSFWQSPRADVGRAQINDALNKGSELVDKGLGAVKGRLNELGGRFSENLDTLSKSYEETKAKQGMSDAERTAERYGAPPPPVATSGDRTVKPTAGSATKTTKPKAPTAAASAAIPAPQPVPKAQPVSDEGNGVSVLDWNKYGAGPEALGVPPGSTVISQTTDDQPTAHPASSHPAAQQIVGNPDVSAEEKLNQLASYFQVPTAEAMRIKADLEKQNASANNLGILAVLLSSIGAGFGSKPGERVYNPGQSLMMMGQGVLGLNQQQAARQAKINELGMKIEEMKTEPRRKAAEIMTTQAAKAAAERDALRKQLLVGQQTGEYGLTREQIRGAAGKEAATIRAQAKQGGGGMTQAQYADILMKADNGAKDWVKTNYLDQGRQPPPGEYDRRKQMLIEQGLSQVGSVPQSMGAGYSSGPATYSVVGGFRRNQ